MDLVRFGGEEEVALEEGDDFFGLVVDKLMAHLSILLISMDICAHRKVPRIRLPLVRSAVRGCERF